MVIMIKGMPVGMVVDEVEEVMSITRPDIDVTPSIIHQHSPGTVSSDRQAPGKLIILVNVNNLISPDELRSLGVSGHPHA